MIEAVFAGAFVQGLTGSLHCPGMCGPFAHAFGRSGRVSVSILYNVMRTLSYGIVGYLLGTSGGAINHLFESGIAAIVGGCLLVLLGLGLVFPRFSVHLRMPDFFLKMIGNVMRSSTGAYAGPAFLGAMSGFMPCGVLWPAYALALGTGVPWVGAVVMVFFSFGTYPAMLAMGLSGGVWREKLSRPVYRVVFAILMIGLGIYTIVAHAFFSEMCRSVAWQS